MGSESRRTIRYAPRRDHEGAKVSRRLLCGVCPQLPRDDHLLTALRTAFVPRCGSRWLVSTWTHSPWKTYLTIAVWSTTAIELGPSRFFQEVLRDPPIIVAGKLSVICESATHVLPLRPRVAETSRLTDIILVSGVGCFTSGLVHTFYIGERVSAKHRLLGGIFLSVVPSLVLLILSDGGKGLDFWRYICPAFFVGAFAMW